MSFLRLSFPSQPSLCACDEQLGLANLWPGAEQPKPCDRRPTALGGHGLFWGGRGRAHPTATHSLVTLGETQGTALRSCAVQSTAWPQHRHRAGNSSSAAGKQRGCAEGAKGTHSLGGVPGAQTGGLQQGAASSSTTVLLLCVASLSPRTQSQPLLSTAGRERC